MHYLDPAEGWDWFVRKTRRTAFMWPWIALVERPDGVMLRSPRIQTVGGTLALALFGGGCLVAAPYAWADNRIGAYIALALGPLFLLCMLLAATWRASVSWDPYGRTLRLCRGHLPFVRTLDLPRDRLRIELSVTDDDSAMSNLKPGYVALSLSYSDRPGRVHLACVEDRSRLDEVVKLLGEFIGAPAEDHTQAPIVSPDGGALEVDTAPFGRDAVMARSLRLSFPSPRVAVFRSGGSGVILEFLFSGVAMAAVFALAAGGSLRTMLPFLIAAAAIGLIAMAAMRAARRTVVADLQSGLISLGKRAKPVAIRDVAAVQTCLFWSEGHDRWTLCEVNLVLSRPAGQRVNLVNDPDPDAAKADARRFADFLGVPLLDHTTPGTAHQ